MVCTHFVTFQQMVAVKELNDNDDMMFLTEFLKEASVMLHLRHPNIIRMYGVILSPIRLVCMRSLYIGYSVIGLPIGYSVISIFVHVYHF